MGANKTQALGVTVFLTAFVIVAAGMATGGNVLLILLGLALLGMSFVPFLRAKPWEHMED